ncbi:hypothetical protein GCM10007159_42160 [Modicisalibacter luteus]|nr:hypothetical protein GCM10007159_42160 [Halomonas lutea]
MLERALDNGMSAGWVTGNSVYGGNRCLRHWFEEREQFFGLAVPCNEPLWWQGPYCNEERSHQPLGYVAPRTHTALVA